MLFNKVSASFSCLNEDKMIRHSHIFGAINLLQFSFLSM